MRVLSKFFSPGFETPEDHTVFDTKHNPIGQLVAVNRENRDCILELDKPVKENDPNRWVRYKTYVIPDEDGSTWLMTTGTSVLKPYEERIKAT